MTSNLRLDAVDPHTYGLRASSACDQLIDQLFESSIPSAVESINQIADCGLRDRIMGAFINYTSTHDRDAFAQMIRGYLYLQANLDLGRHMHALRIIDELPSIELKAEPIEQTQPYPLPAADYTPQFAPMVKVLRDTCMPSHAPTAAISAAS